MRAIFNSLATMAQIFKHAFRPRETVLYPEERPKIPPRWRGRIILSRDPDGEERCVACYLCSVACPVDCIALQATEGEGGRRYPAFFRINFSRHLLRLLRGGVSHLRDPTHPRLRDG
jgi:NADH-quinone oxidoreductase subunit I